MGPRRIIGTLGAQMGTPTLPPIAQGLNRKLVVIWEPPDPWTGPNPTWVTDVSTYYGWWRNSPTNMLNPWNAGQLGLWGGRESNSQVNPYDATNGPSADDPAPDIIWSGQSVGTLAKQVIASPGSHPGIPNALPPLGRRSHRRPNTE